MNEKEADRLRNIADALDDQYYDSCINRDSTNNQDRWFHWAANEIRKVIMDSGFKGIINTKYDTTTTTNKEV